MITFSEVSIGDGDASPCALCGSGRAQAPRDLAAIEQDLLEVAKGHRGSGGPGVAFTGFEPFAHPALPDLIAAAVEAGFARVMLRSDAMALGFGDNARGAVAAGVTHLQIVLLGDPGTHDRLSGRDGAFELARAGAAAFSEAAEGQGSDVFICGVFPACAHNVQAAAAAMAAFAMVGARAVEIDATGAPAGAESSAMLQAAADTATVNRMHAWIERAEGFCEPYGRAPWTYSAAVR